MQAGLNSQNCTQLSPTKAFLHQYFYKLKVYSGFFSALVAAQLIAAIFSLGGTVIAIDQTYTYHYFSGQIVVLFSELWAPIIAVLLCTRQSKNEAFALPASRLSDTLSDIAYLLTGCLFGGVTSALAGVALRVPVYLRNYGILSENAFLPEFGVFCTILSSTALYMLLFSACGYLCGVLARLHKALLVLPAFAAGWIFFERSLPKSSTFFRICWDSIISERSLALFAGRVFALSALMLAIGTVLSLRLEVKQ
jgi:hypothetical protein